MVRSGLAGARVPGLDSQAVCHPAAPGHPDVGHLNTRPRVAVIGGGVAGISAAVALAERRVEVSVFEAEPQLGGRLAGWPATLTDGTRATMTRGFHAFFRQYYNLRALLRRIDPELRLLHPLPDYPLLHSDGTRENFARLPRQPPWNVVAFVARSSTFTVPDLARMRVGAASALFDVSVPRTYDDLDEVDAERFLRDIGFPAAARALAFEVFSRSFFAHPTQFSAAELATMFHLYFLGSGEGLLFDVAREPFPEAIWNPLHRLLATLGADIRVGTRVGSVTRGSHRRFRLCRDNDETGAKSMRREFDAVVLATDVEGLRQLVRASSTPAEPSWRDRIDELRTAPRFLVTRLWLDTPVDVTRDAFLGTAGYEYLDNVTVLDRYDKEARNWASHRNGSVVELHAYALPDDATITQVATAMIADLRQIYPELRHAQVLDQRDLIRADCPLFAPGTYAHRPTVSTPDPTLVLAGDLVRCDLPVALMERAATTGFQAANTLLTQWGVRGHELWSVPNHGRSPLLRRLARRARTARSSHR